MSNQSCTNCGKSGHYYKECQEPITSFGIIAVQFKTAHLPPLQNLHMARAITGFEGSTPQFLLIRRKDTLGYVEFIRGKYNVMEYPYILTLIDQMTIEEKKAILAEEFDILWSRMWKGNPSRSYRAEYDGALSKLNTLRSSRILHILVQQSQTSWEEPEWGFPKGRRGPGESELKCAMREFNEETGLSNYLIQVVRNIEPFEECFFGSNHVHYRHKYYIGMSVGDIPVQINQENIIQTREISAIGWYTLEEALSLLRPYNIEKRQMLLKVSSVFNNYSILPSSQWAETVTRSPIAHDNRLPWNTRRR